MAKNRRVGTFHLCSPKMFLLVAEQCPEMKQVIQQHHENEKDTCIPSPVITDKLDWWNFGLVLYHLYHEDENDHSITLVLDELHSVLKQISYHLVLNEILNSLKEILISSNKESIDDPQIISKHLQLMETVDQKKNYDCYSDIIADLNSQTVNCSLSLDKIKDFLKSLDTTFTSLQDNRDELTKEWLYEIKELHNTPKPSKDNFIEWLIWHMLRP